MPGALLIALLLRAMCTSADRPMPHPAAQRSRQTQASPDASPVTLALTLTLTPTLTPTPPRQRRAEPEAPTNVPSPAPREGRSERTSRSLRMISRDRASSRHTAASMIGKGGGLTRRLAKNDEREKRTAVSGGSAEGRLDDQARVQHQAHEERQEREGHRLSLSGEEAQRRFQEERGA